MRTLSLRRKHLSQEHDAAMKLAVATRQAAIEDDDANIASLAARVCTVFDQEVEQHFQEEELHALPVLRQGGHDDLADQTLREHEKMRGVIRQLKSAPTRELVREFSECLQAHVTFEEDVVWEVLDKLLLAAPA